MPKAPRSCGSTRPSDSRATEIACRFELAAPSVNPLEIFLEGDRHGGICGQPHLVPLDFRDQPAIDEMMTVKFRYKKPGTEKSILIEHPVKQTTSHFEESSNNLRFAASVIEFGMILRDSKFKGASKVTEALALAKSAKGEDSEGYRAEFIKLIEQYQLMDKAEVSR